MSQTIFITGALSETTINLFAINGWTVFAAMRNPEESTSFFGMGNVHLVELDITNPDQILDIAPTFLFIIPYPHM